MMKEPGCVRSAIGIVIILIAVGSIIAATINFIIENPTILLWIIGITGLLIYAFVKQRKAQKEKEERQARIEKDREKWMAVSVEELKNMPLEDYYNSYHWYCTRWQAIERANYRCEVCGKEFKIVSRPFKPVKWTTLDPSTIALQVHHKTYENLGEENASDLLVVCRTCHERIHSIQSRNMQ